MSDLYHNRVLELAASIPHVGRMMDAHGSAEKVSRICGSTVHVDIRLADDGETIEAIAVDPRACALGQATTAILAGNAIGATASEIKAAHAALNAMLKDGGEPPEGRFWELRYLAGVADYPQRHASTMLAFSAAIAAIEASQEKIRASA